MTRAPPKPPSATFRLDGLPQQAPGAGAHYLEFLRVPRLSAGLYLLPRGSVDPQSPHREDELYLVLSGRGQLRVGKATVPAGPGTLVYVPAGEVHAFHSVEEALRLLVVFSPAERQARPRRKPARPHTRRR